MHTKSSETDDLPRAGDIYVLMHDRNCATFKEHVKLIELVIDTFQYSPIVVPRASVIFITRCISDAWRANGAGRYVMVEAIIGGREEQLIWVFDYEGRRI